MSLDNRPCVYMTSTRKIVHNAQQDNADRAHDTKVHRLQHDRRLARPEAEEHRNKRIDNGKDIDQHAPDPRDMERAPDQLCADRVDGLVRIGGEIDALVETPPQEQGGD